MMLAAPSETAAGQLAPPSRPPTGESDRTEGLTDGLNDGLVKALRHWSPRGESERRTADRHAIPLLVSLTPLDGRKGPPSGPTVTVVGKDLSARGVGLYHESRLPYRYCELRIEEPPVGELTLRVELTWTRFTRLGWYESGGRVLACRESDAA